MRRTVCTDVAHAVIAQCLEDDRRWSLQELQALTGIDQATGHKILREDLHMRRIAAKWVPHALTEQQKWCYYETCRIHLERYQNEGENLLNYKVDESKRHHASRKLVGGESIPALGFCDSATLGRDTSPFRFQYSVHCSCFIHEVQYRKRIFICNNFMKKSSWRKCRRKFHRQFPHSPVPDKTTI